MKFDFKKLASVRALVVGDVMLDQYWWGHVDRISPEAPVPVVALEKKTHVVGGAANVAANICGLGANAVLFGNIGQDAEGDLVARLLKKAGIENALTVSGEPTCVKTRIIAGNQQIVRVDVEPSQMTANDGNTGVIGGWNTLQDEVDVIIISDYGKGVVSNSLASEAIGFARSWGVPVLVDPKGKNYEKYRGATVLTPNLKEALEASGKEDDSDGGIKLVGEEMLREFEVEKLVITRGEKGMMLFSQNSEPRNIDTVARNVFDVTGAGDTVIATIAVALAGGYSFDESCELANIAAGIVVETVGTTAIAADSLAPSLSIS